MNKLFVILLIPLLLFSITVKAQEVPYHISNRSVYEFLEEMAGQQIIDLNTAVEPLSREFIATKLQEVKNQQKKLNFRQNADLNFFLKDFNKELLPGKEYKKRVDLFYYKDSLFTFSINPILGIQYWSNEHGTATHWWNGA